MLNFLFIYNTPPQFLHCLPAAFQFRSEWKTVRILIRWKIRREIFFESAKMSSSFICLLRKISGGYRGVFTDTPPPPFPHFYISYENEIIWSPAVRPNYFIFMGYFFKKGIKSAKCPPPPPIPLYIRTPFPEILDPPL